MVEPGSRIGRQVIASLARHLFSMGKAYRRKENDMSRQYQVVAVNGSPHEGLGNTSQMLTMLGENLAREGCRLEEIFLSQ